MKGLDIQNKLILLWKSFSQHLKNNNSVTTMNIYKGGFNKPTLSIAWVVLEV
jgi:hypothetical protein